MSNLKEMQAFLQQEADNLNLKILKFSSWHTENNNVNVDILVEHSSLKGTSIEDCVRINGLARLWLKNANLLSKTNLCVTMPGIDRELFSMEDFVRFLGHNASVELKTPQNNRKRFKGFIKYAEYDLIKLENGFEIFEINWHLIEKASIIPDWGKIMKKTKVEKTKK